jgi:hypothetical protein
MTIGTITVKARNPEDELPSNFLERCVQLLSVAFAEEIDEGQVDFVLTRKGGK